MNVCVRGQVQAPFLPPENFLPGESMKWRAWEEEEHGHIQGQGWSWRRGALCGRPPCEPGLLGQELGWAARWLGLQSPGPGCV